MLLLCAACGQRKEVKVLDSEVVVADSLAADSLAADSASMAGISDKVDETFDDFVYTYASDIRFQLHRTCFPLPYTEDGAQTAIPRGQWVHDALYSNQEYYNMLFESEDDLEYEKDMKVGTVYVDWLYLDKQKIRRYHFGRVKGHWMLQDIREESLAGNPNEGFLQFFYHFCNDSVYQREHIESPLKFVTTDPDDDFKVMEAFISVDQWFVFRPLLPGDKMTNIDYGQPYSKAASQKIVTIRDIGNGYNNMLFFSRHGNSWKLSAFEDLSN